MIYELFELFKIETIFGAFSSPFSEFAHIWLENLRFHVYDLLVWGAIQSYALRVSWTCYIYITHAIRITCIIWERCAREKEVQSTKLYIYIYGIILRQLCVRRKFKLCDKVWVNILSRTKFKGYGGFFDTLEMFTF